MARVKNADRIEEGGIFALYSKEIRNDLVGLAYYGMYALQHRGQESAGFSIFDTISEDRERQKTVKNKGLVSDVFSKEDLKGYAQANQMSLKDAMMDIKDRGYVIQ